MPACHTSCQTSHLRSQCCKGCFPPDLPVRLLQIPNVSCAGRMERSAPAVVASALAVALMPHDSSPSLGDSCVKARAPYKSTNTMDPRSNPGPGPGPRSHLWGRCFYLFLFWLILGKIIRDLLWCHVVFLGFACPPPVHPHVPPPNLSFSVFFWTALHRVASLSTGTSLFSPTQGSRWLRLCSFPLFHLKDLVVRPFP